MRALVLLNASAGTLATMSGRGDAERMVRQALEDAGITADVREIPPTRLTEEARRAAPPRFDAVIAGGGDGTVNAVASALVGSDMSLGVLPLGTLNHFARNLGMPLPWEKAAAALATATVRPVDVGEVNGTVFINNASIGLYPRIVGKRDRLRSQLGGNKWAAMAIATLWVFRRPPDLRVRFRLADGRSADRETALIFVGNNPYHVSFFAVGERPCLDGGNLGLYFATRSGRLALLELAIKALFGRLRRAKDFEEKTVAEFSIEARRRRARVAVDGELCRLSLPLRFRSWPGALRVLAPPEIRATCRPGSP